MRNKIVFLIILLFCLLPGISRANDQVLSGSGPGSKLDSYTSHASSQKLYLHFNKNMYSVGEVIWFSAYILDAVTHLPDTARTNIYVDLINSNGVIMEKRILLANKGVAEGDINLSLTLPDGNYLLRAYTDWMRNFEEEFYFTRYLYISNSRYDDIIPRSEVRLNKRFNSNLAKKEGEYQIAFFPEGGDMIQGVNNRIAFKAVDALGRGLDAVGVILDGAGNEVVKFTTLHAGMGIFELQPEAGSTFRASVEFNDSRPVVVDLPSSRPDGIALRVEKKEGEISLNIFSGLSPQDQAYKSGYTVVAHTRGRVIFTESLALDDGKAGISLAENMFPGGITHITVFSEAMVPVAERLVFIDRDDSFMISPRVVRVEHEDQEYLGLQVGVTDSEGNAVDGKFSISILSGGFDPPGSSENLISNFLLTSDLQGLVENPQYYFDSGKEMEAELDLLLMTHGWRRFNWESVLSGALPELSHSPGSGLTISGRIRDPAKDDPVNNYPVEMKVLSGDNAVYISRTDNRGYFIFDSLNYSDEFRIQISSQRLPGDYPPEITLNSMDSRGYDYVPNFFTREQQIIQRGREWKRVPEAGRSRYAVTRDQGRTPQRYGIPDQTIYIDRDKITQRTVYDLLVERGQGLQIYGNQIMFRGPSSINLSSEPMFMIDGVQTARDNVLSYNPRELERVELFRGTSAAAFGVRGGAGVIVAYTRQAGDRGFQDSKEYRMIGYHSPREFYSDFITPSPSAISGSEYARTVFWKPDILAGDDEDNTILFPLTGNSGRIKVVIEGVGNSGGMGTGEFTIELQQ